MINYKIITEEQKVIVSLTCDCCMKKYSDVMDRQEFLIIDATGGFYSATGDDVHYQCDLCSGCTKRLLGKYLRYIE